MAVRGQMTPMTYSGVILVCSLNNAMWTRPILHHEIMDFHWNASLPTTVSQELNLSPTAQCPNHYTGILEFLFGPEGRLPPTCPPRPLSNLVFLFSHPNTDKAQTCLASSTQPEQSRVCVSMAVPNIYYF